MWVADFTAFAVAFALGLLEALLMQRLYAGQEGFGTVDGGQRSVFQLLKAGAEEFLGLTEQLGGSQIDGDQVGLEFLDQLLQRRGDFRNRQNAGHVGTALEGMQRPLQVIGHRLRQFLRAIGEKTDQGIQVGFRLVAENLQQLWVEGLAIKGFAVPRLIIERFSSDRRADLDFLDQGFDGRLVLHGAIGSLGVAHGLGYLCGDRGVRFWGRQALGQGMRRGRQQVNIIALALSFGSELVDQRRHQRDHVHHHLLHGLAGLDTAFEHTVEEVLDRPGQLADHQRMHHAPTALESMESATNLDQRILVLGIGLPLRQVLGDGFQHLAGFLDEDFEQLIVHRFFVGRRR